MEDEEQRVWCGAHQVAGAGMQEWRRQGVGNGLAQPGEMGCSRSPKVLKNLDSTLL